MENSTLLIIAIICISLVIYFYLDGFDRFFGGENFERIAPRGTNIRKDGAGHMNAHGLGVNRGRGQMPAVRDSVYGTLPNNTPQSILGQNLYGYDKEPMSGASRSDLRNILTPESPGYVPPNDTLYALGGAYNRARGVSVTANEFKGKLATFDKDSGRVVAESAANRRARNEDASQAAYASRMAADRGSQVSNAQSYAIAEQIKAAEDTNLLSGNVETRMRPMPNVGNVLN